MARSWIKSVFTKPARRPAGRFAPRVTELEGRDVPATFYVDPTAVNNAGNGTFNAGRPDAHTGPFNTAVDGGVFDDFASAVNAANTTAGTDTINLAYTANLIFVNPRANLAAPVSAGNPVSANTPLQITESLNVVGSSSGASVLQTSNYIDQTGAVLLVNKTGATAVTVNFSNLTFFGGASGFVGNTGNVTPADPVLQTGDSQTGVFVKYQGGATGTIDKASFGGIYANNFKGFGAAASGAGSHLTISNSTFGNIGRVGAAADTGGQLDLFSNQYTGKGAGPFVDIFGQYTSGGTGTVSGNRVTGNSGITPGGDISAALLVSQGGGAASSVSAFGNSFFGNYTGVIVGDNAADTSTATLSYNNIFGNFFGVDANPDAGTPVIDATHVWWGTTTGPFNVTNNATGTGNSVDDRVTFAPVATGQNQVLAAPNLAAYITATLPAVTVAVVANAAEPSTAGTFRFTRTGGDLTQPLTINYTVSGTATPGVDYTALSGVATIPANTTFVDVPFTPIDDNLPEPTETVIINITASANYNVTGATATGFIVDNDTTATATVTVAVVTDAAEPATNGTFRFTRTGGDLTQPLTVTYTVGGTATAGTDYTALSGTVTFAANQTTADATVAVIDDKIPEPTETIVVTITAGPGYTGDGVPASMNLADDDNQAGPNPILVGYREFGAGSDAGGGPVASLYNPDGTLRFTQAVFPGGTDGGVRTAAGDVNGVGVADLIVGTGPGVPAQVRVLDGVTQAVLAVLTPFGSFTGGVYVATGDVTGDGLADVIVTPDQTGGPRVVVYTAAGFTQVASFFGIDDPNFFGGVRAAAADMNGDGRADIVVAAGFGGGPRVAFFDGTTISSPNPKKLTGDIFVFEQSLRNGVFVAAGDMDGDGKADLIVGGGPGGGPRVLALSGADLMAGKADGSKVLANFFAGDDANRGGVHVAAKNLDNDTKADLVVGPGPGGGDRVFGYLGKDFVNGVAPGAFAFDAFGGFTGGVFVG
jgi:hypothetical protein